MIGDDAGAIEMTPEQGAQGSIDARATSNLGFLQELEAAVQRQLAQPVFANRHLGAQDLDPTGRGDASLDLVEVWQRVCRAAWFAVVRERHRVARTLEKA